ncbi:hypothetical protein CH333_06135 [candidate division WOR-3 bacterium JGI_Cruoil_03_44_89]|uniref:Outer membrane protein beta-barrel domain-containing protein n=1 Tax=candidate division WOR-3 bacterium JGI_Cruoil_03_44_89 TaxID=1973748 RepID=A0A235BSK7_UNCW3|nr:MAG: hypothetical protein CH333_06135 [candidate division WOR-3 bacterium JGI_Cruoil_03_44_89]
MKKIFSFVLLGTFWLSASPTYAAEFYPKLVINEDIAYKIKLPRYIPPPKTDDEISMRIRGIGRYLAGIVSDTITDMLWNPARLPSKSFISLRVPNRIITSLPGPLKTRWGILLEGSYHKSENEHRDTEPSYHYPYWDYHYTDYLSSGSRYHSNKTYKGALLGSKQVTPNTCIGLRLDYHLNPHKSSGERIYRYTRESKYDGHERLNIRDYIDEHNSADTTSSYSFCIGTLSSIWKSDLEIVLGYKQQKETGKFLNSGTHTNHEEYTSTHDSTTHIDIHNDESEGLANEYDFLNPKIWSLGLRLSRDITPTSTFRTIAVLYSGCGDAQREEKNLDYDYHDYHYSHSDPETSYVYGDTTELYQEDETILDGDASILGGFLALGQEFSVSPQLSAGVGIRISYERSEVKLEGTRDEVYDTLTSHSMLKEKDIVRRTYIYLPVGIEYKPIPEIALRFGVDIYGFYHFSEKNANGWYNRSEYTDGPNYDLSFGAGYKWRRFKFDIYTMDIAAVRSWDIEMGYSF